MANTVTVLASGSGVFTASGSGTDVFNVPAGSAPATGDLVVGFFTWTDPEQGALRYSLNGSILGGSPGIVGSSNAGQPFGFAEFLFENVTAGETYTLHFELLNGALNPGANRHCQDIYYAFAVLAISDVNYGDSDLHLPVVIPNLGGAVPGSPPVSNPELGGGADLNLPDAAFRTRGFTQAAVAGIGWNYAGGSLVPDAPPPPDFTSPPGYGPPWSNQQQVGTSSGKTNQTDDPTGNPAVSRDVQLWFAYDVQYNNPASAWTIGTPLPWWATNGKLQGTALTSGNQSFFRYGTGAAGCLADHAGQPVVPGETAPANLEGYGARYFRVNVNGGRIMFRRALYQTPAGGWDLQQLITPGPSDGQPCIERDWRGRLWVFYTRTSGANSDIYYVYSDDDGDTWSTPTLAIPGGKFPRMRRDKLSGQAIVGAVVGTQIQGQFRNPGDTDWGSLFTFQDTNNNPLAVSSTDSFDLDWGQEGPRRIVGVFDIGGSLQEWFSVDAGQHWTKVN